MGARTVGNGFLQYLDEEWFGTAAASGGTAVAQWIRCCATNRKVAGSNPAGVSGFFIDVKSGRLSLQRK